MKRFLLFMLLVLAVTGMVMNVADAQAKVKVTFIVNTSTIPDTIKGATSTLAIQGDFPAPYSWSDVPMTNIGGDYWMGSDSIPVGKVITNGFKFRANGGWENDFAVKNNRQLTVGSNDTTLPVMFYNTLSSKPDPYWKPWPSTGTDSLNVWFRVNMKNAKDSTKFGWTSADVDSVAIVGDNLSATGDIDAATSNFLKREGTTDFYSGRVRYKKSVATGGQTVNYHFRLGKLAARDETPTRSFTIPLNSADTTLPYVYFNNDKPYYAPPVNVTFILNTAAIPDTILAKTSKMTVTGDFPELTNWGGGVALTNVGGDYWKVTIKMNQTQAPKGFKFRANGGWESNFAVKNDRQLQIGNADTTLPVQYYYDGIYASGPPQYWTPWPATSSDSLNVWVRVNMQAVIDNATFGWKPNDKDSVVVMGAGSGISADLDWGVSHYLKQEKNPAFFSGRIRVKKSAVIDTQKVEFKFRLGNLWGRDELQGKPNRKFSIPIGKVDTTLAYVYYDNAAPIARVNADTAIITFRVNMKNAIDKKGFTSGDTLVVQSGFFKTGATDGKEKQLKQVVGSLYQVTDTIITTFGKTLNYQYYLVKNGNRVREYYFNFDYAGINNSEQERRQIAQVAGTKAAPQSTVLDTILSNDNARRQPLFPSQAPLKQDVTVKWVLDLRPAYAQIKQGATLKDGQGIADFKLSNIDSIKIVGVGMNGPATNLPTVYPVGDWATWSAPFMTADTAKRKMWDNGLKGGDATAGDTLYSITFVYPSGSNAGKISKYGIKGGDNETGFGLNHLDNIDDANSTFTINVQWGSINPKFYWAWDFTNNKPQGVAKDGLEIPKEFALHQNYPNPFNPSTTIEFALPIQSNVTLTVYNVLGQEIATLVNEPMKAGKQSVTFDASRFSSGVYFYRLNAGQFNSIKKMMLLK
ncbi:MAG: T9SS type A sorting domain-containing protein [Bacteroidota bacterium]|nr:T9SS type A sorting domain-containing protein [Bacteroidota bacterium]